MTWRVYKHHGNYRELALSAPTAEKAYNGLLGLVWGEAYDSGDENKMLRRIMPTYSMVSSRRVEVYSPRFLTGQEFVHFAKKYGGVLAHMAEAYGRDASKYTWLVSTSPTTDVFVVKTLDKAIETMGKDKSFQPYKNCAIYDTASGSEGMVVRLHIRMAPKQSQRNPKRRR